MAKSYKEQLPKKQGLDLEPKTDKEIKSQKGQNERSREFDEEARLSGSKDLQYLREKNHLGSYPNCDDHSEESFP